MEDKIDFIFLNGFQPIQPAPDLLNYMKELINEILNSDSWSMTTNNDGYTVIYETKKTINI